MVESPVTGSQQLLSGYRLLEKIGEGGMGVVYRATDTRLRRDVAIKFISEKSLSRDHRERFLREARLAAALNHPNICIIHQVGELSRIEAIELEDGTRLAEQAPYLVMELIEGSTLVERRAAAGLLPIEEVLEIADQIADALAEAHRQGIVHRDLKPSNVMVTATGRVKILDFGLAKALRPGPGEESAGAACGPDEPTLTSGQLLAGTPAYMSPEQARGVSVDARSDIFSFGSMIYELSTGRPAFRGDSVPQILTSVLDSEQESLLDLRNDVPPGLDRIVRRCLRKQPERRYNDTRDLVNSIRDLLASWRSRQPTDDLSRQRPAPTKEGPGSRFDGPAQTAFGGWCDRQTLPGLKPETFTEILEYVIRQQEEVGSWPGHGDHWSEVKTACILKALALLEFRSADRWLVGEGASRHEGGTARSLGFLADRLANLSLADSLVGEDIWDTCQVLLALAAFGRMDAGARCANEINRGWSGLYRTACEAIPRISWVGPGYLAALGDVLVCYRQVLEGEFALDGLFTELRSLERTEKGARSGAYHAVNSSDPNKHRWNTSLVLRSIAAWPSVDPELIARTAVWLLEELERADEWLGADRESPMYLARCLAGLHAASSRVGSDLEERIRESLERGNMRLDAYWSPTEAQRTGDLKAYSAVLEYLAGWKLQIPAGLVFGLTSATSPGRTEPSR